MCFKQWLQEAIQRGFCKNTSIREYFRNWWEGLVNGYDSLAGMHRVKAECLVSPNTLIWEICKGSNELVFLTMSPVMPVRMVHGPHCENPQVTKILWKSKDSFQLLF